MKKVLILLCIFLMFLSSCRKNNPPSSVTEIPVGVVLSLTGSFGPYGINQQNGITMAVNEINGTMEIPAGVLKVYFRDDQSNPDTCQKVFRSLIRDQKVKFIIGPTSSNSAFQADTIAQHEQVIVLGISNTVPGITAMGDYIFRNSLPESSVIPNTVAVTHARLGYSRVGIIWGDDDAYTIGAYEIFKNTLENTPGVSIVQTETVKKGDTFFTPKLENIKAANPDVIVITALVNEASRLMVQARQIGIPASVSFIGGNNFNSARLAQLAGPAADGAICGAAWIESEDTPGNFQFVSNYQTLYDALPDQFAAQAYAAVRIITDAIKNSVSASQADLRAAMAATNQLPTILGSFSFDANRDPVHPPIVQHLVNGKFELYE